jgi:hypothetical protein
MRANLYGRRSLVPTLCVGTHPSRRSASPRSTRSVGTNRFPRRAREPGQWRKTEGLLPLPSPLSPRPSSRRRGVLLLVVLALLAIFALVAVAFVVLTSHARRGADAIKKIDSVIDPPQLLLQQAAMHVLHGPPCNAAGIPNPASALGAGSLLEEMYGNKYVTGTFSAASSVTGFAQLINGTASALLGPPTSAYPNGTPVASTDIPAEIFNRGGCVLTITNPYRNNDPTQPNPLYGQSTHIVSVTPGSAGFQLAAFSLLDSTTNQPLVPAANDEFVINGVPFSGYGFGFAADGSLLSDVTAGTASGPLALLPNYRSSSGGADNRNPLGGANSDYTAPDFQHMLLAAQVLNGTTVRTLPSMHRPALCRYWVTKADSGATFADQDSLGNAARGTSAEVLRATVFRPLPTDHPNFTGSNPTYTGSSASDYYQTGFNPCWDGVTDPTKFSWDVDNDGDGAPDSIWIDLGMPVRATADGRLYKPLFAILCVDLDGRANVNAHGSLQLADTTNLSTLHLFVSNSTFPTQITPSFAANTQPTARGQGLGPAEINLGAVLTASNAYQQVLCGTSTGGNTYEGRYGSAKEPGAADTTTDSLYFNNWVEYGARDYWNMAGTSSTTTAGAYGSPPDPYGVGVVGLDQAGRPLYCGFNYLGSLSSYVGFGSTPTVNSLLQYEKTVARNPYELNLGPDAPRGLSSATNNLFSPSELERLLRPYDVDAPNLPDRLKTLASLSTIDARLKLTTEGWDFPGLVGPIEKRVTEVLKKRLMAAPTSLSDAAATKLLPQVLPPEMFVGLKMNINRPFGNGRDDLGNGVVDSPSEITSQTVTLSGQTASTFSFDGRSDTSATVDAAKSPTTSLAARQLMARYLYVMVFTLGDRSKLVDALGGTGTDKAGTAARAVAQWAVNAVDFSDRDNIMTPFDYDLNYAYDDATHPISNGSSIWNPKTDGSCRVWGCERPGLLISETLAFHDRRTQDTDTEDATTIDQAADSDAQTKAGKTDATTADEKDKSFDQTYRPQGSLFVELYNPSSPFDPQSGDLYSYSTSTRKWYLSLAQISASSGVSAKPSPVWRLLIASGTVSGGTFVGTTLVPDPDDPDTGKRPTIEREVYFVSTDKATLPAKVGKVQYYPTKTPTDAAIPPGGYAVVGPGESDTAYQNKHPKRTYIGFLTSSATAAGGWPVGNDSTRRIDLDSTSSTTLPVQHNVNSPVDPQSSLINNPVKLAIDLPYRLSVSEPIDSSGVNEYTTMETKAFATAIGMSRDHDGKYVKGSAAAAIDVPFDLRREDDKDAKIFAKDQTNAAYRIIYLQRLANPLKPYNNVPTSADYNPYLTVDNMAVDLTVFNGATTDADEKKDSQITHGDIHFEARQRGEHNDADASNMNLWKQEPVDKSQWAASRNLADASYFTMALKHSFGYLNQPFGTPAANNTTGATEVGLPPNNGTPFPWLTWNNRPYVSPLELMLVPMLSSSQLLGNACSGTTTDPTTTDEYCKGFSFLHAGNSATLAIYSTDNLTGTKVRYPHLINFFQSSADGKGSAEFHRILDQLSVPSPFVGTDLWANPTLAANAAGQPYHPPFNRISNYREPGRINLNTIYDQNVFNAVMGGTNTTSQAWNDFVTSRSGGTSTSILAMPAVTSPTEFAHPFRSSAAANLIPSISELKPKLEIDATLLRQGATNEHPLFESTSANACDNTDRNPYFYYQGLQRLQNLVTTRSNVFAVWITVGYFEVSSAATLHSTWTQAQLDAIYPDGYTLGRELGIDTGQTERHRGFYIIDRTLPVGFMRGKDLNSEKSILVNRFIE